MKIILTKGEAKKLNKVLDSIELNGSNKFIESFKKEVSVDYEVLNGRTIITISPEYITEFLSMCAKYARIFVTQAYALCSTIGLIRSESNHISKKYFPEERGE